MNSESQRQGASADEYDAAFAFEACGVDAPPSESDRRRLFNVSYDLATREVKLYLLSDDGSSLSKVSRLEVTTQTSGALAPDAETRLAGFLACDIDFTEIILDTVEDDVFYVYIERAAASHYVHFLESLCRRFGYGMDHLVRIANRINTRQIASLYECMQARSISGLKIPLEDGYCKAYARPFLTGNGFVLPDHAAEFLARLHRCCTSDLLPRLTHLWVSAEFDSDRVVLTTQRHALLHGRRG